MEPTIHFALSVPDRHRRVPLAMVAAAALLLGSLTAQDPAEPPRPDKVGEARSVMEKWYEVNDVYSKEANQWRLEKQLLEDLIEIRKNELAAVRARTAQNRDSTAEAVAKKSELEARHAELVGAAESLRSTVATLESRTSALLKRLPDPVLERVRPIAQALPDLADQDSGAGEGDAGDRPAKPDIPLSKRVITVLGVLQEVHRFQRELTVVPEERQLPDGRLAQVTSMYLGIGQGYYVTREGDAAGVGTATADGWVWMPANESAEAIGRAIAIAQNEAPAAFVRLPVRIR